MTRLILALAILAAVFAGCGSDRDRTVAETEGIYLTIDGLKYQIQMSRYVNPKDVEDREYMIGVPEDSVTPAADETLFGVWIRVQNESGETLPAANTWEIEDTQENVYEPIAIDTEINPFAFPFEATDVAPNTVLPLASSAAGQGPTQGLLLLFKLKTESLQNRPLELRFSHSGGGQTGTYDLDV
jgi:hypothetical protein